MDNRVQVNLKQSICTDTPVGADLFQFGDPEAKHLQNTGIERNGGITNIYEKETTFATAGLNSVITTSGDLLQVDASDDVRLNNVVIGNVGSYTVNTRGILPEYIDVALEVGGASAIGIKRSGTIVTIDEINLLTGAVINTRTATFGGMPSNPHKSMYIVNYTNMAWADDQEFIVNGSGATSQSYRLRESDLSTTSVSAVAPYLSRDFHMYRFLANEYILYEQGGVIASVATGDIGAWTLYAGKWVVIEQFLGTAYARALITFDVYKNAANLLTGYGYMGYDSGGAFSAVVTYVGSALGAVTAVITNAINGPGYSECTYTRSDTGTDIYHYYAPQWDIGVAAYGVYALTTYTATPINAFGKLTNNYNNTTHDLQIRFGMINGTPSFLSVAYANYQYDTLGVPLTNVGEVDANYPVHVRASVDNYCTLIYKYKNTIHFIYMTGVGVAAGHTISKVSDNLYQINCLSPYNTVDITKIKVVLGVNDYNGRAVVVCPAVTTLHKVAFKINTDSVNSIDVGDRLCSAVTGFAPTIIPGIDIPVFIPNEVALGINVFYDDLYSVSRQMYLGGGLYSNPELVNTIYVADTRIPIAMGYSYENKTAVTDLETIFLGVGVLGITDVVYDYLCYELGNTTLGIFHEFVLFEQQYLFDGRDIFVAKFNGSIYVGRDIVCPGTGCTLIAASPTEAYFLSTFDNSIYTFDGGRSLNKFIRMNSEPVILNGIYNVRDNTLLLNAESAFIWVRDGIVTANLKKATQLTGVTLYDTVNGIVIASNTISWIYSFLILSGSTVVPLTWQSAYFGILTNINAVLAAYVVTLYNAAKTASDVTVTLDSFDVDQTITQIAIQHINPADWNTLGFYRFRIQPQTPIGLGAAIKIQTNDRLGINSVIPEFTGDTEAVVRAARSL